MNGAPVLFLPIVEWEFRTQRPQHLARCFARAGFRVYYPDLRFSAEPRAPALTESGIWRLSLAGDPAHDPYRERLGQEAVERALSSLRALAAAHPLAGCWIVAQLPSWRPLAEAARRELGGRLLFDCVDEFAAFADHSEMEREEAALARGADLVVAVTEPLCRKLAGLGARPVLVRNGCEPDHFGAVAGRVRGAGSAGPPVIGFFGGIHDWFDAQLVAELADARPEWEIWLVGDTYRGEVEALRTRANVRFLGELPYADLPRVISHFDVGIIPFKLTPLTEVVETVKVYEMLAAGLPVVATELPELRRLAPLVAIAGSAEDFGARVEEALAEPADARAARRAFARGQSWLERFLQLRRAMDAAVAGDGGAAEAGAGGVGGVGSVDGAATGGGETGWAAEAAAGVGEAAAAVAEAAAGAELRHDRAALGLAGPELEPAALRRRLAILEAAAAGGAVERQQLLRQVAGSEEERRSLIEQRGRVQAESERLGTELTRLDGERLRLEQELRRVTSSRWWRLAARVRRLRERLEG